jgi:CBS domain containing-hemolysin-like protein
MEAHSSKFIYLAATYFDISKMQQDAGLLLLLFTLLFLSFAIAGSEVAFFSLSYKDIQVLKTKNHKPLKRIVDLLEEPNTYSRFRVYH